MSNQEAVSRIFWMAFKTMPKTQQNVFISMLCQDNETRQDLMDLALIESRRHEKARPFSEYLASSRKKRHH